MSRRPSAGRAGHRWRTISAEFKRQCRATNAPCWRCGQPIDYDAKPQTPNAFEPDHYYPVSTHPHLANDPANLRPSHCRCNRSRGNEAAVVGTWARSDF
ncbi:HNH endonuclease [Gordonia sp. HY442]|uniref:HNH endonuclease n=1 Tax=Gordonia zhenghanii TaxID=2911516 RepID=UPI001F00305C|nr:HNH endonuclease [Gordonia zhenghanii]MCF8605141.1 HNH endonuclease [Gordonia zhenghanii]